jgi:putative DNA primase/helicase
LASLKPPEAVAKATEEYLIDEDWLDLFIEECCRTGPNLKCKSSDLFKVYKWWAESGKEFVLSQRRFSQRLLDEGYKQVRGVDRCFVGLTHLDEDGVWKWVPPDR